MISAALTCLCGSLVVDSDANSNITEGCDEQEANFQLVNDTQLSEDEESLGSCLTDGACFASLKRESASRTRTNFRCVPAHLLDPKERPLMCHVSRMQRAEYAAGCCDDGDRCNGEIALGLPHVQMGRHI